MYNADMKSSIFNAFCTVMIPQHDISSLEYYCGRFYAYGIFGLFEEWIQRKFKESPNEMVDLFYQVIDNKNSIY